MHSRVSTTIAISKQETKIVAHFTTRYRRLTRCGGAGSDTYAHSTSGKGKSFSNDW